MLGKTLSNLIHELQDQNKVRVSRERSEDIMRQAKIALVKSIIHEYATYSPEGFYLFIQDVDRDIQKLLLSYVTETEEEYQEACQSDRALDAYLKEYRQVMQNLIDLYIDDCYHEAMREKGLTQGVYQDNGEVFYYRK